MVAARGWGPGLRKADCFPFTILNLQVLSTLLVPQCGGTAVVMDRVDPVGIAEWLTAERAGVFNGAPAMLYGLAHSDEVDPGALAGLDEVWSGGSPLPEGTRQAFQKRFACPLCTTYGLTEAPTLVAITSPGDQDHLQTSGVPLPHLEVAILDADGVEVGAGETAEICLRGVREGPWAGAYRPMLGYFERAEASAAALRGGWLHTGDLGSLDDEGYLYVADRQSSLILRGGANVYPAEVERVLDEFPGVAASCVVGVADDRLGERVVAAVEALPGADLDLEALRAHCGANLARYKVPERFVLGPLTRNSMGKVSRRDVLARLGGLGD
jgi:acyl-CoA synthetase (AMP-forming)/AMP-acid ligase II